MRISQTRSRFLNLSNHDLNKALWIRHNYIREPQWVTDLLGPKGAKYAPKPGGGFHAHR